MSRKQPKRKGNPKKTKKPKSSSVVSADNRELVWNVSKVDNDGQWGWDQVNCSYFFQEIWEKMHDFEKKKWSEILGRDHRKNHKIQVRKIIGDAQKRLEELVLCQVPNDEYIIWFSDALCRSCCRSELCSRSLYLSTLA